MKGTHRFNRLFLALVLLGLIVSPAMAKKAPSLDKWKPDFDPKTARFKCIISNVSTPALAGIRAGFDMRDEVWKRTNGQIFIDYKPFSILGGEVEAMNMLQMGAIQGMGLSVVVGTSMGPRLGVLNLPFVADSYEKVEKFAGNETLFNHFLNAMDHQGITGVDITGYGNYGWATVKPVQTIDDAGKIKFRIAEAKVNQLAYRSWGFNPVSMPWPDVQIALKQGVITGLDQTPVVCELTKKFEVAKYFTRLNYGQGLFVWCFNKQWLQSLPDDLRTVLVLSVKTVCKRIRKESARQESDSIDVAKAAGVRFFTLPDNEMKRLKEKSRNVYDHFEKEINHLYPGDTYRPGNYLKEVLDFMQ